MGLGHPFTESVCSREAHSSLNRLGTRKVTEVVPVLARGALCCNLMFKKAVRCAFAAAVACGTLSESHCGSGWQVVVFD